MLLVPWASLAAQGGEGFRVRLSLTSDSRELCDLEQCLNLSVLPVSI